MTPPENCLYIDDRASGLGLNIKGMDILLFALFFALFFHIPFLRTFSNYVIFFPVVTLSWNQRVQWYYQISHARHRGPIPGHFQEQTTKGWGGAVPLALSCPSPLVWMYNKCVNVSFQLHLTVSYGPSNDNAFRPSWWELGWNVRQTTPGS